MGPFRARSSINSRNVRWRASNICKSFSQSISHIRRQIWWNGGRNLWDNFAIRDLFLFVDVCFQLKPLCLFRNNCTFLLLNFKSGHCWGTRGGTKGNDDQILPSILKRFGISVALQRISNFLSFEDRKAFALY